MIKKIAFTALAAFILIAFIYTGYWFSLAYGVKNSLGAWQTATEKQGDKLIFSDVSMSGYPLNVTLNIKDVILAQKQGTTWAIPLFTATTPVLHPLDITISAPEKITLHSEVKDVLPFDVTVDSFSASSHTASHHSKQSLTTILSGLNFIPDKNSVSKLTPYTIKQISVGFDIIPGIPATMFNMDAVKEWKDKGGKIPLTDFSIITDDMRLTVTGETTLDNNLQPEFSGELSLTGLDNILDRFIKSGAFNESVANLVRAFVTMLNNGNPPTTDQPVIAPVKIKSGMLSVGSFPIIKLDNISWFQKEHKENFDGQRKIFIEPETNTTGAPTETSDIRINDKP